MMFRTALLTASLGTLANTVPAEVERPAALTVSGGVPAVSDALVDATRPYMESRAAGFAGWNASDRTMLISTRFANVSQLHSVAMPLGMRRQISFEGEPVRGSWSPNGDVLLIEKDNGGDEFFQLYTLANGRLGLLTAGGKSRNSGGGWSLDGSIASFSSTERNGTDSDLYLIDPRNPSTKRLIAEVKGGGWAIAAIAPGNHNAIAAEYVSATKVNLYRLDLASGKLDPIGNHRQDIAYGSAEYAPDGTLWITSDANSDVQRLGRLDPVSGKFTPVGPQSRWDVDSFALSKDGRTVAVITNQAGISKLSLMDSTSGALRPVAGLPAGVISGPEFAPWGELGFTLSSAKSPTDAYSLDPATLKVTRWTRSETGGLDPSLNVEPELVTVKSFDGESVSGFLYRPNAANFPGKRPLIVDIHGGPEGQALPSFRGRSNYLLNDKGIAIFYPNVRGSSGYGKRFINLDNGPFKREDSVKDIGAFLTRLSADPGLDPERMAVTGGSYGGYMCYASAIAYADRFKAALCTVAISNFVTFLEGTQSYRRDLRRVEYGDERVPEQRAKLMDISPLRRIAEIKAPLFVVAGANDPRVPKAEADQIVAAIRGRGGTAWYMIGENEGHGFAKKENQDYLFWTTILFWNQNLLKP
ncbi:MAG: prolyl oligopeptidase family serine peptidase [Sphingomicrobium sp.]